MAEHAGQKRAAVKFLNRGEKGNEHRAKGKESASDDDPEDAHEAVRRGTGHNIPMRTSSISLHRRDAHAAAQRRGGLAVGAARGCQGGAAAARPGCLPRTTAGAA